MEQRITREKDKIKAARIAQPKQSVTSGHQATRYPPDSAMRRVV
jgi:hypothetical protein